MLLADFTPEDIVVSKAVPMVRDLGSTAKRCGVEVGKNLKRDFSWEDGEGVYSYKVAEFLCEKGELGEATHCEYALEDEFPPGVRGRGKVGPDGIDDLSLLLGEGVEGLRGRMSSDESSVSSDEPAEA